MKSLNEPIMKHIISDKFGQECYDFLLIEGFTSTKNDSYCYKKHNDDWTGDCLLKNIESSNYTINVYIFENGIGVDFDYTCGGNSSTYFWKFKSYTFEEAYDFMVDEVNKWK
ncbi:hypothetical protein M0Q97_10660 [Candidatus Dojkabacteria bacterium]|jgi:hypothetical protein|nr:hypothetical protein [Candidatus Dojkabacteria bacterium]